MSSNLEAILWILLAVLVSAFFSTLRQALQFSLPERVLGRTQSEAVIQRTTPLLEKADGLAASAGLLKVACDAIFVALLIDVFTQDRALEWSYVVYALLVAAPALLLFTEALPTATARYRGDTLLLIILPTFSIAQWPVGVISNLLNGLRKAILRMTGVPDPSSSTRRIVEGLRGVIEEAAISGDLDPSERELIENVMEFREVDVAEVMTPRTEIHAVEQSASPLEIVQIFAEHGVSRVPVYEEDIDTIIGTVTALAISKTLSSGTLETTQLTDIMRPATFVPETKLVSELLAEFRQEKQKMAIVLDEYGGTAGIVTLADVIAEIVGDIEDEYADAMEPMHEVGDGSFEVLAGVHVSDVNEALDLEIPEEEDFETLGGFVLAELGHFPKAGESFTHSQVQYSVLEASDRRVFRVSVRRSA